MKIDRKVKNISFIDGREFGVEIEIAGFSTVGIKRFYNNLNNHTLLDYTAQRRIDRLSSRDHYTRKQILVDFISDYTNFRVDSEGYHHSLSRDVNSVNTNQKIWTMKDDSSVSGAGLELISGNANNVLQGTQGLNELFIITEALKVAKAKVNSSTGIHVHHSNRDLNLSHQNQIINLYNSNSIAIAAMLPNSRVNNSYARPLQVDLTSTLQNDVADNNDNSYLTQSQNNLSRYSVINFTNVTVEFRQHSGTIEFEKIKNWIVFTQAIINESIRRVDNKKTDNKMTVDMSYRVQVISRLLNDTTTKDLVTTKLVNSLVKDSVRQMLKSLKVKYVSTHMTPRDEHTEELGNYINKRVRQLTINNESKKLFSSSHKTLNMLNVNQNSKVTIDKKIRVQNTFNNISDYLVNTTNNQVTQKVSDINTMMKNS